MNEIQNLNSENDLHIVNHLEPRRVGTTSGSNPDLYKRFGMECIKKLHDDLGEVGDIAKIANFASANFHYPLLWYVCRNIPLGNFKTLYVS